MRNGSNHWVEQQPDPWPGGNIKSFVATSWDRLPSHLTKLEEPQTAASTLLGLTSVPYILMVEPGSQSKSAQQEHYKWGMQFAMNLFNN